MKKMPPIVCSAVACIAEAEFYAGVALCRLHVEKLSGLFASDSLPNQFVYYVQWEPDDWIKIGTTHRLRERMIALGRPKVLAVEPGSYGVESERHAQFTDLRKPRTELFRPSPSLVAWTKALAAKYPTHWREC